MEEYLIVDGYNMIGAWPELRKLKDISLEEARDKLISMLADYRAYSGMNTIVVFDAHQVPGLGGKYRQNGLNIQFTKEKETADECIERLVAELSHRRRQIYVATSDYVEQNVTFGQGALRIAARELLLNIKEGQKEIRQKVDEGKTVKQSTFEARLSKDLLRILEKWRRGED